jgi:hypothetical protein
MSDRRLQDLIRFDFDSEPARKIDWRRARFG